MAWHDVALAGLAYFVSASLPLKLDAKGGVQRAVSQSNRRYDIRRAAASYAAPTPNSSHFSRELSSLLSGRAVAPASRNKENQDAFFAASPEPGVDIFG
eukprot:201350-Pleurochrysis_carterae.AAC.1